MSNFRIMNEKGRSFHHIEPHIHTSTAAVESPDQSFKRLEATKMVFQKQTNTLNAEARVDLKILSTHYTRHNKNKSDQRPVTSFYLPKDAARFVSRPNDRSPVVMSLSDLSAARRRTGKNRHAPGRFLAGLFQKSRKKPKKRAIASTNSNEAGTFAMEQYRKDIIDTLKKDGINPVVGASSDALADDSSHSSDDTSMGRLVPLQSEDARDEGVDSGRDSPSALDTLGDTTTRTTTTGFAGYVCWFFGCNVDTTALPPMPPTSSVYRKQSSSKLRQGTMKNLTTHSSISGSQDYSLDTFPTEEEEEVVEEEDKDNLSENVGTHHPARDQVLERREDVVDDGDSDMDYDLS